MRRAAKAEGFDRAFIAAVLGIASISLMACGQNAHLGTPVNQTGSSSDGDTAGDGFGGVAPGSQPGTAPPGTAPGEPLPPGEDPIPVDATPVNEEAGGGSASDSSGALGSGTETGGSGGSSSGGGQPGSAGTGTGSAASTETTSSSSTETATDAATSSESATSTAVESASQTESATSTSIGGGGETNTSSSTSGDSGTETTTATSSESATATASESATATASESATATASESSTATATNTTSSTESATSSTTSIAVTPKDGKNGADGLNGRDGRDGRDGFNGCGVEPYVERFSARPLTRSEREALVLPYRSTRQHPVKTLDIGQKGYLSKLGFPFVRDSQVIFAIDLNLPRRETVTAVKGAALQLKVTKYSADDYTRTEMICLLDQKLCSGELFSAKSWKANINPAFFPGADAKDAEIPKLASDAFATRILDRKIDVVGAYRLYSSDFFYLPLEEIFSLKEEELLELIYAGADPTRPAVRALPIVVADDTYVGDAILELSLEVDTCRKGDTP